MLILPFYNVEGSFEGEKFTTKCTLQEVTLKTH